MNDHPAITVIGSYAVGLTMKTLRFPSPGETLVGHDFQVLHGGKGSNQAVACARLGANVRFLACIGRDGFGNGAMDLYATEGIDTGLILRSETLPTGAGFIMVDDLGHNEILIDFGANRGLTPEAVSAAEPCIAQSDAVLLQMEIPLETVFAAAALASDLGRIVLLNPAPYQPLPEEIWQHCTVVTPNEKEARLILGYKPQEEVPVEELGRGLVRKGVRIAVITLGEKGALVAAPDFMCLIPARPVPVVDTTGAGDAFSAALGVALCEGVGVEDAVRFASQAAAKSVQQYGVIDSLPYRHQLDL